MSKLLGYLTVAQGQSKGKRKPFWKMEKWNWLIIATAIITSFHSRKKEKVIEIKERDHWRSARNVRDKLELPVHRITVWRVFKEKGLNRENLKQIKPGIILKKCCFLSISGFFFQVKIPFNKVYLSSSF